MDETSFEIDLNVLAESARRFPAHRQTEPVAHPIADMSYIASAPGAAFGRRAWDECGHL
ncbi:MAG: hypothetical protein H7288_16670 [Kineosporiaceae bacterium]|nr:hypothetical protein [Aeromicrobium sp.]